LKIAYTRHKQSLQTRAKYPLIYREQICDMYEPNKAEKLRKGMEYVTLCGLSIYI